MAPSDYPFEKTRWGDQFIIPGTERVPQPKPKKRDPVREGDQFALPGTEALTTRELLQRLAAEPLTAEVKKRRRKKI